MPIQTNKAKKVSILDIFISYVRSVYKYVLHFFTGKSRIQRLIKPNKREFPKHLSHKVSYELQHSKQLAGLYEEINSPHGVALDISDKICQIKKIHGTPNNLRRALTTIHALYLFKSKLISSTNEPFNAEIPSHSSDLENLKEAYNLYSNNHTLIECGFQNEEVQSDFRSIGSAAPSLLCDTLDGEALVRTVDASFENSYPYACAQLRAIRHCTDRLLSGDWDYAFLNRMDDKEITYMNGARLIFVKTVRGLMTKLDEEWGWESTNPRSVMEFETFFKGVAKSFEKDVQNMKTNLIQ